MTTESANHHELPPDLMDLIEHAREFRLHALCDELGRRGYGAQEIHFASVPSLGPTTREVHGMRCLQRFRPKQGATSDGAGTPRKVEIEILVGSGLFSGTSPLPDYLRRIASSYPDGKPLRRLLALLDDALHHEARAQSRDGLAGVIESSPQAQSQPGMRDLAALDASWNLDWLFRQCFPELQVLTMRDEVTSLGTGQMALLGTSVIGEAGLGSFREMRSSGQRVNLVAPEAYSDRGQWWPDCVRSRMAKWIVPRLAGQHLRLHVRLTLPATQPALAFDSAATLGLSALGVQRTGTLELEIFQGVIDHFVTSSPENTIDFDGAAQLATDHFAQAE